jgi:hypothetical protein
MADDRRLVHAISRAGAKPPNRVEAVRVGELQAACSPLAPDADEPDPAWLAAEAQRHHATVRHLFEAGPVLPIRFGTVLNAEDIGSLLQSHASQLTAELDRLTGVAEWGVKIVIDPDSLARAAESSSDALRELDAELTTSTQGRGYLLKRKREALLGDAVERHADRVTEDVRAGLAMLSIEDAHLPPPSVTPAGQHVIANLAFLVAAPRAPEFEAAADRLARSAGVGLELSGPWPPYSFVRLSLGGES